MHAAAISGLRTTIGAENQQPLLQLVVFSQMLPLETGSSERVASPCRSKAMNMKVPVACARIHAFGGAQFDVRLLLHPPQLAATVPGYPASRKPEVSYRSLDERGRLPLQFSGICISVQSCARRGY